MKLFAVLTAAAAALLLPTPSSTVTLTIDASVRLGAVNRELVGVGWHPGGPGLAAVADLAPHIVRIDASLQDVSPAPGELRLGPLLDHVAAARAIGGDPLVILSYMPAWLGAPNALGRDPTRVAPADLAAWEALVHDVVHALATAPAPAYRFEAWNEPDIPLFWQDTPTAWSTMVAASARAIARVEAETGVDLQFGGPATAVPDPVYLAAFLAPLRDASLPLDFISWHYYGNTPFLGPDGNEFGALAPVHPIVGRRNPVASPASYGQQVTLMREWTRALLAGTGRPDPALVIDEWNLSAGGYDRRHDSREGAAFAAGVLVEMQQAGLDESAFFQMADAAGPSIEYGGHGLVRHDGTPKPVWQTFRQWQQLAGERVAISGAGNGVWAIASVEEGRVTVLVASFSASAPKDRTVELAFEGLGWQPGPVRVALPANSVAFIERTRDG